MFNYIWASMIVFSIILSFFTGRVEEVALAASSGASGAVNTCLEIAGIMMLWSGLMRQACVTATTPWMNSLLKAGAVNE